MRIALVSFWLSLSACNGHLCETTEEVISVGVCDGSGNCGALTTGGYRTLKRPVPGQLVTYRRYCESER
jgi:hypothetical protein